MRLQSVNRENVTSCFPARGPSRKDKNGQIGRFAVSLSRQVVPRYCRTSGESATVEGSWADIGLTPMARAVIQDCTQHRAVRNACPCRHPPEPETAASACWLAPWTSRIIEGRLAPRHNCEGGMSRPRFKPGLITSTALAAMIAGAGIVFRPDRAIRVATGFVSHTLCSGAFVSGLNPDEVYPRGGEAHARHGSGRLGRSDYTVDTTRREVRTTLAGAFASRAVYREGRGCTLVDAGRAIDALLPQSVASEGSAPASLVPPIAGPCRRITPMADWGRPSTKRSPSPIFHGSVGRRRSSSFRAGASWRSAMRRATASTRPSWDGPWRNPAADAVGGHPRSRVGSRSTCRPRCPRGVILPTHATPSPSTTCYG